MRLLSVVTLTALLIAGCSSPSPNGGLGYGQLQNEQMFGTVVTQRQIQSTNVYGIVGNNTATTQTGSWYSSLPFMGGTSNDSGSSDTTLTVQYVIDLTNGNRVTINQVPQENEPVMYPGQKVMIQNNNGFIRVLPANVEGRRDY